MTGPAISGTMEAEALTIVEREIDTWDDVLITEMSSSASLREITVQGTVAVTGEGVVSDTMIDALQEELETELGQTVHLSLFAIYGDTFSR